MKKLFTFVILLVVTAGFSQSNDVSIFKSENYTINGTQYTAPETIVTISDTDINVKPIGNLKIIKKAVSVRNTSVYHCDYQGKRVEVITFISTEKLKVTVRGENLKYIIESDLIDPKKMDEEFSKSAVTANR